MDALVDALQVESVVAAAPDYRAVVPRELGVRGAAVEGRSADPTDVITCTGLGTLFLLRLKGGSLPGPWTDMVLCWNQLQPAAARDQGAVCFLKMKQAFKSITHHAAQHALESYLF